MSVSSEGTRVSVWTNAMAREAIKQDQNSDGTFGLAKLKDEFRCYIPAHDENNQNENGTGHHSEEMQQQATPGDTKQEGFICDSETEHGAFSCHNDEEELQCNNDQVMRDETILFSDPETINRFLHMNIPPGCSPQDVVTYKEAISEACYTFEVGLKNMIGKLSQIPKQKKRKNRDKKQSTRRHKNKQRSEAANNQSNHSETAEACDEDYVCADGVAERDQTPVPMAKETFGVTESVQESDETPNNGCFKLVRRKRRERRKQRPAVTDGIKVQISEDIQTKDAIDMEDINLGNVHTKEDTVDLDVRAEEVKETAQENVEITQGQTHQNTFNVQGVASLEVEQGQTITNPNQKEDPITVKINSSSDLGLDKLHQNVQPDASLDAGNQNVYFPEIEASKFTTANFNSLLELVRTEPLGKLQLNQTFCI